MDKEETTELIQSVVAEVRSMRAQLSDPHSDTSKLDEILRSAETQLTKKTMEMNISKAATMPKRSTLPVESSQPISQRNRVRHIKNSQSHLVVSKKSHLGGRHADVPVQKILENERKVDALINPWKKNNSKLVKESVDMLFPNPSPKTPSISQSKQISETPYKRSALRNPDGDFRMTGVMGVSAPKRKERGHFVNEGVYAESDRPFEPTPNVEMDLTLLHSTPQKREKLKSMKPLSNKSETLTPRSKSKKVPPKHTPRTPRTHAPLSTPRGGGWLSGKPKALQVQLQAPTQNMTTSTSKGKAPRLESKQTVLVLRRRFGGALPKLNEAASQGLGFRAITRDDIEGVDPVTSISELSQTEQTAGSLGDMGVLVASTELEEFRMKNHNIMHHVAVVLNQLDSLRSDAHVLALQLNADVLAQLARSFGSGDIPQKQLLRCVLNRDALQRALKIHCTQTDNTPDTPDEAAIRIQGVWRKKERQRKQRRTKAERAAARTIHAYWWMRRNLLGIKERLKQRREEDRLRYDNLQTELASSWNEIKGADRIHVHLPSDSHSTLIRQSLKPGELNIIQNSQMIARMADAIRNKRVSVIYIAPFRLSKDIENNLHDMIHASCKLHELSEADEIGISNRIHVLVPEIITSADVDNARGLPSHMSLTELLLYSPQCLKRINKLCFGKPAVIIPKIVSEYEISLSCRLGIPVLGPSTHGVVDEVQFSSCTLAREIALESRLLVPPGCVIEPRSKKNKFFHTVAECISHNPSITSWVFRIDGYCNDPTHITGDWWCIVDVSGLESLSGVNDSNKTKSVENSNDELYIGILKPEKADVQPLSLEDDLKDNLSSIAMLPHPRIVSNFSKFRTIISKHGGIMQAYMGDFNQFGVSFLVEPTNKASTVTSISRHEPMVMKKKKSLRHVGSLLSYPGDHETNIAKEVGQCLTSKGIWGNATVWMCAVDGTNFVTNIEFALSMPACSAPLRDVFAGPKLVRYLASSWRLYSSQLAMLHYSALFKMLRMQNMDFNLATHIGSIIDIKTSFTSGVIDIHYLDEDIQHALVHLRKTLSVLNTALNTATDPHTLITSTRYSDSIAAIDHSLN